MIITPPTSNMGIYRITNLVNQKIYIGQSTDLKRRFSEYKNIKKASRLMERALNKYGTDNFKIEPILYCSLENLDIFERCFIHTFDTMDRDYGYNLESGGSLNKKHSSETKQLIREKRKKQIFTDETRQKLSDARKGEKHHFFGVKFSDEYRKKLRESHKGYKYSEERKLQCSERMTGEKNPFFGKKHTEEYKKKSSERMKGTISKCRKKVIAISVETKEERLFDSLSAAQKAGFSNVANCIAGRQKTCHGHTFRYAI